MIWTQPKQIGPVQNDWYSSKMICTVQNHFVPIEGQGMMVMHAFSFHASDCGVPGCREMPCPSMDPK